MGSMSRTPDGPGLSYVPDGPADRRAGRAGTVLPAGPRDRDRAGGLARRLDVSRSRRHRAARRTARADRCRAAAAGARSITTLPMACRREFQWLRTPETGRIFRARTGRAGADRPRKPRLAGSNRRWSPAASSISAMPPRPSWPLSRPNTYQQAAGLTTYYNRCKFHALMLTHEAGTGPRADDLVLPGRLAGRGAELSAAGAGAGRPRARSRCGSRSTTRASGSSGGRAATGRRSGRCSTPRDLGRGRPRRAWLVHRRLRRHGRLRHHRAAAPRRGSRASITCPMPMPERD